MSYLEQLRNRRKTPKSAWHKLKTSINTDKYDFFLVFEGEEDEDFFSKFAEEKMPGKPFRPIICDGKGGVLAIQQEMIEHFGSFRNVFFFLDSDHDRFIGASNYPEQTFNTCGYSVESYLYCEKTCLAAIKKCYQLRDNDPLLNEVEKRIESDFHKFEKRALSVMAYVVALRKDDQVLSLDGLTFSHMFEFSESGLNRKQLRCDPALEAVQAQSKLCLPNFLVALRELKGHCPSQIIRGKLVAQFVLHLIKGIPSFFKDQTKLNGKPLKPRVELGKRNIMYVVSGEINTPPRLEEFLDKIDASLAVSPQV